jgi:hypothetical protein
VSIETSIPPSVLLDEDPAMLWTMIDVLNERAKRG